jgi:hypothetical protein
MSGQRRHQVMEVGGRREKDAADRPMSTVSGTGLDLVAAPREHNPVAGLSDQQQHQQLSPDLYGPVAGGDGRRRRSLAVATGTHTYADEIVGRECAAVC